MTSRGCLISAVLWQCVFLIHACHADDLGFNENPTDFVPNPTNAMLVLTTGDLFVWKTEGRHSEHVIPKVPHRFYLQTNLNSVGRLIYQSTDQGRERHLIGVSPQGSLLWHRDERLWAGTYTRSLNMPEYSVHLASEDVHVSTLTNLNTVGPRFLGDAVSPWPVQLSITNSGQVTRYIVESVRKLLADGLLKIEDLADGPGMDIPIPLKAEMTGRFGETTLFFCPVHPYASYPRWNDVVTRSSGRLSDGDINKVWPVARISENGFVIWDGKAWTTVAWHTTPTNTALPNQSPNGTQ